eukprot:366107-Chlamydomonas_euryale.AAC.7
MSASCPASCCRAGSHATTLEPDRSIPRPAHRKQCVVALPLFRSRFLSLDASLRAAAEGAGRLTCRVLRSFPRAADRNSGPSPTHRRCSVLPRLVQSTARVLPRPRGRRSWNPRESPRACRGKQLKGARTGRRLCRAAPSRAAAAARQRAGRPKQGTNIDRRRAVKRYTTGPARERHWAGDREGEYVDVTGPARHCLEGARETDRD